MLKFVFNAATLQDLTTSGLLNFKKFLVKTICTV